MFAASTQPQMSLEDEIQSLKKTRDALLLVHYYQTGDIQDIADGIGDSLVLAQMGAESKAKVVILAGVVFMAESVKILSPEKIVLVADARAGCSLVDSSPYEDYLAWRLKYPDAICISYVNSSAAVKAISDVICTSSNAERIIRAVPEDRRILFGPDQNLGNYLAKKTGREMIMWNGSCEVHVLFSEKKLFQMKSEHPNAVVIAHPECTGPVLRYADVIGSTSKLLEEVQKNPAKEFIVATETGILHQMQKSRPDALILQAPAEGNCACNDCPYMKLNTLEKVRNALRDMKPQVEVDPKFVELAQISLRRMLELSKGNQIDWPSQFNPPSF
jgi:quinolinate synthase